MKWVEKKGMEFKCTFGSNALLLKVIKVGALLAQVLVDPAALTLVVARALGSWRRVQVFIACATVVIDFTCQEGCRQAN